MGRMCAVIFGHKCATVLSLKNDAVHESLKQHDSWKASWQFFPLLIPSQQFPTHPHRLIPHHWTQIPGYTSSLSGTWSSHMYLYRQDAHGDTQRETVYTHPDLGVTRAVEWSSTCGRFVALKWQMTTQSEGLQRHRTTICKGCESLPVHLPFSLTKNPCPHCKRWLKETSLFKHSFCTWF